ncbi:MAG TPA: AraC family transcriptional regulator [Candidatus Limiplasma sp.]|nr:AraC family transcriptional regulator [Candidatus Limiplasma sp.]HRX07625.1 AraC family transcriptional regulator [Candidatus Limiplasma sp.]
MKLIRAGKTHWVFRKFLIGFLPIFLIPLIVMVAIYISSNAATNKQTFERNLAVMQRSADTFQKTFVNMDNVISYLDRDSDIGNFLTFVNPKNDISNTIDMISTQNVLKSLTITNSIIRNIMLYSKLNNIVVDSSTSGLFIDRYYTYNHIKDMPQDVWQSEFLNGKHNYDIFSNVDVIISGQPHKYIVYAKSLPISETVNIKGNIFIYLDQEYLLSQFVQIPYQSSGFIYILDKQGNTIIYDNKSALDHPVADASNFTEQSGYFFQTIDNKEMFVTYYREAKKNWYFVSALPKNQVLEPTARIRFYIEFLILFTTLTGGALLIRTVSRLSKPISHIFALFAEKNQNLSYNDFEHEISNLVDTNEKMQEALNSQIPEIKTSVFYNLLIRGYNDPAVIRQNLSRIKINLDAKYYVILIAAVNELSTDARLEDISAQKLYLNSVLAQHFDTIQGIYNLDFERTVLLLSFQEQEQTKIFAEIERSTKEVVDIFGNIQMSVSFSGDITHDIGKIQSVFLNAFTATNYKEKNTYSTVQWYIRTLPTTKSNFYYPIELESQMMLFAMAGNTTRLAEIFAKIDRRNQSILTKEYNPVFYNLLLAMNTTLIRILNESCCQTPQLIQTGAKITDMIETKGDLQKILYLIKDTIMSITLQIKDEQGKNYINQHTLILQYIDEHYTDNQLSLTSVADTFHITEGYLSSLFKDISGENFSKYIEKLRMERAFELIRNGFKINEVAQMSGYNSPQVFRRAYRRHYGTAPTASAGSDKQSDEA